MFLAKAISKRKFNGVAYLRDDLEQIKINYSPSLLVTQSPRHPEPSHNDATPI
jgi:hypothetical protein